MPCTGTLGDHVVKHPRPKHGSDSILLFNRIEVHVSHTMATSGALKLHFCVSCGAYGAARSNHLKLPCTYRVSKAGREALQCIGRGEMPNSAAARHYQKFGHKWVKKMAAKGGIGGGLGPLALAPPDPSPSQPSSSSSLQVLGLPSGSHKRPREEVVSESQKETGRQSRPRQGSKIGSPLGAGALAGPASLTPHVLFQAWGGGRLTDFRPL